MNPVAIRLLNQQLICQQFATPAQVVDHMGAIQAQEYRMMRWAVEMRTINPSREAFKKAFDSGQIVRLHLMRGTWQLVSASDYYPLLKLCGSKALSVIKGWMSSNKISIPEHEVAKIRPILVHAAEKSGSATKEDFVQALSEKDISMDEHRLSYHIRLAELDGILCSGELLPMKASYALSESKIPFDPWISREEALLLITRKYFRSRQPATLEDFVWWSGLNVNDCRRGIQMAGDYLHAEQWAGRTFYLTDDVRTRGFRRGNYLLIPPYDEYLIAYKSRDVVLPGDFSHKAHNNMGTFKPVIALDGQICGNWSPFSNNHQASFFTGEHDSGVQTEWARYQRFLSR